MSERVPFPDVVAQLCEIIDQHVVIRMLDDDVTLEDLSAWATGRALPKEHREDRLRAAHSVLQPASNVIDRTDLHHWLLEHNDVLNCSPVEYVRWHFISERYTRHHLERAIHHFVIDIYA